MKSDISKAQMFDPHLSFFELPVVRNTTIVIVAFIAIVSIAILIVSNPTWDPSYKGFNHFFTVFKFPLYGLGFLASLLALYATNHRSEQNRASMDLTAVQNKFTNYYKHLGEFSDYVEKMEVEYDSHSIQLLHVDARKLHGFLFAGAHKGSYALNTDVVDRFENSFNNFLKVVKDFCAMAENDNPHGKLFNALKCRDELEELFNGLIVGVKPNYAADIDYNRILKIPDHRENLFIPKSLRIFFTDISKIYKQIYFVMAFDTKYDPKNHQKNKILGLCNQFISMKFELDLITNDWDEGKYAVSNDDLRKIKEILSAFFEEHFS